MKIFIDSADIKEIKSVADLGICDGVTTNPSLISKTGQDFKTVLHEIVNIIAGPVSAEIVATDYADMVKEAETLARISNNIVIKIPLTPEGLKVCRTLGGKGIKTNVTLCFNANQALLAAKAGATYVSPFIGRLYDSGVDGLKILQEIRTLYTAHHFETKILSASIRKVEQVTAVAMIGSDAVTIPHSIFSQMYLHPLTEKGLSQFMDDWKKSGQASI